MNTSLLKELRFKIGEQYELNEFNLKTIKSTFIDDLEYENYEYIKDDFKTLFGLKLTSNVILQYNADILCGVIYEFNNADYNSLLKKVICYTSTKSKIIIDSSKNDSTVTIEMDNNIFLGLIKNRGNLIVSMF